VDKDYAVVNLSIIETAFANITFYLYNSSLDVVNETNSSSLLSFLNFSNLADINERYYYNATVRDRLGRENSTETRVITLDNSPPLAFNLSIPLNDTQSINASPFLNWTAAADVPDDSQFWNYTVYVDDSMDFSSPNFAYLVGYKNSSNNSFFVRDQWSGNMQWYWKVAAFDIFNHTITSTDYYTYIIDNATPQISLITPFNHSYENISLVSFKFNVTDQFTAANCSLLINGDVSSVDSPITKNSTLTIPINLPNGNYNWSINCTDKAGNMNTSAYRNITVNAPPLITHYFLDTSETDFNQGTKHLTNITGLGDEANVTLNYTESQSGASRGHRIYNTSGNFTSRTFDSGANNTRFSHILWSSSLPNSTDIIGIAADNTDNTVGVFYRNGSTGVDTLQTNYLTDITFTNYFQRYTLPAGYSYDDIACLTMDDDASQRVDVFFRNGTILSTGDLGVGSFNQTLAIPNTASTYTLPANFNTSNLLGCALDSGAGFYALFFLNGSFLSTSAADEVPPIAFNAVRAYALPAGWSYGDILSTTFDDGANDLGVFFRNGSVLVDAASAFSADILSTDFTAVVNAVYNSGSITGNNITESTNITLQTRVSNDSVAWTNWVFSNFSPAPIPDIAQYIQYKAVLTTNDKYITPSLQNVTINYTDLQAPNITFTPPTPLNGTFIKNTYVFINTSTFDGHSTSQCILEFDNVNESMLLRRDGHNATCFLNKTSLSEGVHHYRVWANDTWGNTGSSEQRNITVDLTAPSLTFISQNPSIVYNFNNVTSIVSITDNYQINTTFIEGNWSNRFTNDSLSPNVTSFYNFTILEQNLSSREVVFYRFYANDTVGNLQTTQWFNFSVVPAIANVSLLRPLYEITISINETLIVNATLMAVNGTIENCMLNISNQTGLVVFGQSNRTVGTLPNGTTSATAGWILNGTIPGIYTANITSNCTDGDSTRATTPPIEVLSSLANLSDTTYIEKKTIDGVSYFHSTTDTGVNWWLNTSNYEQLLTFDSPYPSSAWFKGRWLLVLNGSIVLDFTNITWDQQKAGINNESNYTFLQLTGRALNFQLQVNLTQRWYEHSLYDNLTFDVRNLGNAPFSDVKLKWAFANFNIGNNSNTDTLLLTNATTQTENYTMDSTTSLEYNQSRLNATRLFFSDTQAETKGIVYWDFNMTVNGVKQAIQNFTLQAGGTNFNINLTFGLGTLAVGQVKGLDPGAGLATPGSIRRTAAIANMEASEAGTTYTDVTAVLTDNNFGTQSFLDARTGDVVRVLNIVNNTDPSPFDQIFLRVRVDSMTQSPYYTAVYAYNSNNVTVSLAANGNHTFTNAMANTWVQVNITNVAHLQDGFGYMRVRFTPNGSVVGTNLRLTLDEIRFNLTDMSPPSISLVSPVSNFNTTSDTILFNFTVSDKVDMNITCNVTIDGVVNQSVLNITNGTSFNFTKVNLSAGPHYWNVTCWDDSANINTSLTRNFTIVQGPSAFTIELAPNNESLNLTWSVSGGADYYNIHMIDQFTDAFSATPNASVADTNFTDSTAGNKTTRFYRVYAAKGSVNHTTNKTVAKYELELINNSNEVTDWHLISLPLNITNFNLTNGSNAGMDLRVKPHGCIKSLYFYNATIPKFMRTDYNGTAWFPAAGSENFTSLQPGRGYWAEINISCNLTFVGEVPRLNITSSLAQGWNVVGWYSPNISTLPTDSAPPYPVVVNPEDAIQAIDRYNPATDQFEVTIHYTFGGSAWGWWPSFNNQDFTSLEPTKGYYFDTAPAATWAHKPNTQRDD